MVALMNNERLPWFEARRRFFDELVEVNSEVEEEVAADSVKIHKEGEWVRLKGVACEVIKVRRGMIPSIDLWNPETNQIVMGVLPHQLE